MNKEQKDELKVQLILMGISLLLTLLVYWVASLPEWKRKMFLTELRKRLSPVIDVTTEADSQVRRFRQEISRWEHEQKAKNRKGRD